MKTKIIAVSLIVFMAFQASAQVGFGVRGGFGLFNLDVIWDGEKDDDFKLAPKFNLGAYAEFNVAENFLFQPGLFFATKGSKAKFDAFKSSYTASYNLNYLELPLNFLYNFVLPCGLLHLGGGPYVGYGLGGKLVYSNGSSSSYDIVFANEYSMDSNTGTTLKPIDYGFNIMVAYLRSCGLNFGLNAQMGLANLYVPYNSPVPRKSDKSPGNSSMRNIGFNLFVGYKF